VEHRRGMSNPPAGSPRRCGVGKRPLDGEGGSADTDPAGAHVYAKLGLDFEREGVGRVLLVLTKGSWRAGTQCGGAGVGVRRRRTAEHDDGVAGGELWSSWSCGSTCDVPVMSPRGSGGPEMLRRRGNAVVPEFTGVGSQAQFRRSSGRSFDQVARRCTGRRGGAGAGVLAAREVAEGRVRGDAEPLRR